MSREKIAPLGIVVDFGRSPDHLSCVFQLRDDADVRVGEFVEIPAGSYVIIGRVTRIVSKNTFLSDPQFVKQHLDERIPIGSRIAINMRQWREAHIEIIALLRNGSLEPPSIPPEPGEYVYPATRDVLRRILNLRDDGIFIGFLYTDSNVYIKVDPEVLLRLHFAVFGATGSGKSYTVGVIIEEFLDHGYPVVIFDVHGEYHTLGIPNDNQDDLQKLRAIGLSPRKYDVEVVGDPKIGFENLDVDTISDLSDLTPVMRDLLYLSFSEMKRQGLNSMDGLRRAISATASKYSFDNRTKTALLRRIETIKELKIFGGGMNIERSLAKGRCVVINLSGIESEFEKRAVVGVTLRKLFRARKEKTIPPTLVVIEESHLFAPQDEETYSKQMMRRIAREGRKFGIGIGVVSQRIIGLDKDVISQCGTKIILRIDSKTDIDYLRPYMGLATEEDLKRLPYLPRGTAFITGQATQHPILVKIRPRKTKHLQML